MLKSGQDNFEIQARANLQIMQCFGTNNQVKAKLRKACAKTEFPRVYPYDCCYKNLFLFNGLKCANLVLLTNKIKKCPFFFNFFTFMAKIHAC